MVILEFHACIKSIHQHKTSKTGKKKSGTSLHKRSDAQTINLVNLKNFL